MVSPAPPATFPLQRLGSLVTGSVVTPQDPGYDAARSVFYGGIDRRPAAIVRPADARDVSSVVSFARDAGIELAVRSGGHSLSGHSVSDGGVVLDLRDMKALQIDPDAGTAWAETGLTAGEYSRAAGEHGLATSFGDTGSVGIGGITLGGGVGYLVRKHGLTIDSLLAADVVTADGELRRADAATHPDLYWAIRGGGGNFGVATRLLFRLHPVPGFVGGMLVLPATVEVLTGFVAAAQAAPDELSTIANVMPAPPMPFVAPEHHGKPVVLSTLAHAGDVGLSEHALAPFRALGTPIADMVRPMAYPAIYPPDDDAHRPRVVVRTLFLDAFDESLADTILRRIESSDAAMRVAQLRVLGGAMARVPAAATAFAHRTRRILVNVAASYDRPEERAAREGWVSGFADTIRGGDAAAYVSFLGDEGKARVRDAYPEPTWQRLGEIKRRYDPTNVFRLNQNIPPGPVR